MDEPILAGEMERSLQPTTPRTFWTTAVYCMMVAGTIGLFLVIRSHGALLTAPAPPALLETASLRSAPMTPQVNALWHILLILVVVIVAGRAIGLLFLVFQQPSVIGEVVAGILLGPSLLGRIAPEVSTYLLPPSVVPLLGVIAQLGIILYMFKVGLELNLDLLQKQVHAMVAISHASIIVPFLLGGLLALHLYPRLSSSDVPFTNFALFLGVAMSITAFPVLARILTDRRMSKTGIGVIALMCAATDDATAWCLLALVVGVTQARVGGALLVMVLTLAYLGFMLVVVQPLVRRYVSSSGKGLLPQGLVTVAFTALLLSALTTEWIGIHAIFGAFLLGAIIPHDSALTRDLTAKLEDLVAIVMLPAFFAFTGMRTQ